MKMIPGIYIRVAKMLTGILVGSLETCLYTAVDLGWVGQHTRHFDGMGGYQILLCRDRIIHCCKRLYSNWGISVSLPITLFVT